MLTPLHWSDGAIIALKRLASAIRAAGAALVVDAMQAVGAVPPLRCPHILGLGCPAGLIGRLHKDKMFASDRLGGLRLSPHVRAHEADVARCLAALRAALC